MIGKFNKAETAELMKEFLFIVGSDLPEGRIKPAWERFIQVKLQAKWRSDLDELVDEGLIELSIDESGEFRCELTELGLRSSRRHELEGMPV